MKRLYRNIAITLMSIILVNALLSNVSFGENKSPMSALEIPTVQTPEDIERYLNQGSAVGGDKSAIRIDGKKSEAVGKETNRTTDLTSEQGGYISTGIAHLIAALGRILQTLLSSFVGTNAASDDMFTIESLVLGKYELFDINVFNTSPDYQNKSEISKKLKESVSVWYGTIRVIAVMLSFVVLLYIAIRMALSTIASDRAKYKKMLMAWFAGFALIFILHYIIMILIYFSDALVKILASISQNSGKQFEVALVERIYLGKGSGWDNIVRAIMYCILAVFQLKYFVFYLKRLISNSFLILIAPLVTVTYAADKANDCKAQAFNSWKTELTVNIFIQPLHALIFMVFMFSAGKIAELYPVIALIFLFGLSWSEKLLRNIFKLNGSSIGEVNKSLSMGSLIE